MTNTQTVAANGAEQWRDKRALAGGGSLPEIGLYCINTARFLTGEEPTECTPGDAGYAEVEETVAWTMRFPSNFMAQCLNSYGARDDRSQKLNFATATVDMPGAYRYACRQMFVAHNVGDEDQRQQVNVTPKNQFAAEIDHMAECVLADRRPPTPGEEG